jgi:hypothetical protein
MDRQCPSCGGLCKKLGCERENVRPQREWVGLATEEAKMFYDSKLSRSDLIAKIDEFLEEKNS